MKHTDEIKALKELIDNDIDREEYPKDPELIPLYESVVLMKRRYESRLREVSQAADERDAFYGEMQNIRAQHHMAEEIQRSMLPSDPERYLDAYGIDLFADMDTAWEVGGDYYDHFPLDENRLFFCIGDVSGKGVPAAIFCSVVKTLIGVSVQNSDDMAEVFSNVSRSLYTRQNSLGKLFVTIWAGIFDRRDGYVTYINAGHDSPYIIKADGIIENVETRSGMPVAAYYNPKKPEKSSYSTSTIRLGKDDMLVLYTDGLTDSGDTEGNRYGRDSLEERLKKIPGSRMSAKETVTYLERSIGTFSDESRRDDDITIVAIRNLGKMDLPHSG